MSDQNPYSDTAHRLMIIVDNALESVVDGDHLAEARAATIALLEALKKEMEEYEDYACDYAEFRITRYLEELQK